jgi:maltose phosphorylase
MVKVADRYLDVDPWAVVERGFHPGRARVSESIFSLGNEYMGVRGYFEEGYSGDSLLGSFFNGIYEETGICHPQMFKGLATRRCFMVNAVDWLHTRLSLDGEQLDLAQSRVSDFERRLDLKAGTLSRSFVWETAAGKQLRLTFVRFLSMADPHLGVQRITMTPLNFSGEVTLFSALDFSTVHEMMGENYWICPRREQTDDVIAMLGETVSSKQKVFSGFRLQSDAPLVPRLEEEDKLIGLRCSITLVVDEPVTVDKLVTNLAEKDPDVTREEVWDRGMVLAAPAGRARDLTYDEALARHRVYWDEVWATSDVEIVGDPANQQGLRFCIFQLHQTYHGVDASLNVGAKGLTGEVYFGWTFWDTETYCLPFYLFNNPKAARNLLGYRYRTLPQAKGRAQQLDCRGARYPMGTIDGTESVGTWQHGDLEIHVSAAVSYGIWHYVHVTGDRAFLYDEGIEMLVEISRFFADRGAWSPQTGEFGFWGVMGPDEFHMMVHNNTYTNLLAQKTFTWTLETLDEMAATAPERLARLDLDEEELESWTEMANHMRINYDPETRLFEQHDGYFDMPEVDVRAIPPDQFPIYKNWAYDSIFRVNMIKQPDVLLFLFFFSQDYDMVTKLANYEYYEPRCSHESSLSPGIHSIMAAELGKHEDAYAYSLHAARLDLDNYNRNTHEGLHTTSMAAAWLLMVYGFGGMRSDGDLLIFRPSIPANWEAFSFRLIVRGTVLGVRVDKTAIELRALSGPPVVVQVFERTYEVGAGGVEVAMPAHRIGT